MMLKQREMMMAVTMAQAKDRFHWYSAFVGTVAFLGSVAFLRKGVTTGILESMHTIIILYGTVFLCIGRSSAIGAIIVWLGFPI